MRTFIYRCVPAMQVTTPSVHRAFLFHFPETPIPRAPLRSSSTQTRTWPTRACQRNRPATSLSLLGSALCWQSNHGEKSLPSSLTVSLEFIGMKAQRRDNTIYINRALNFVRQKKMKSLSHNRPRAKLWLPPCLPPVCRVLGLVQRSHSSNTRSLLQASARRDWPSLF